MGFIKEFKNFAIKGNVVDMAVGIIIGAAFGKIVTSLVNDIIMPPIGMLINGMNFTALKVTLKKAAVDSAGKVIPAVTVNYGSFIQTTIDFLIVAFAIFLLIKAINELKRKEAARPSEPPAPSKEELLLTEIRDLLKSDH